MTTVLAVRDNETGKVLECRELAEGEPKTLPALLAAKRKVNPPPRFDVVVGLAPTLEAFLQSYPRFAGQQTKGEADADRGNQ